MARLPALGRRGEGWLLLQGVVLAIVALAGLAGPAWTGPARMTSTIVGAAGLAAGGLLAARGITDLGRALTPFPYPREDAELVDRGAYRLVRHPVYGGLLLGGLGWALVTASPLALLAVAGAAVFFDLKARREEAWLRGRFPEYERYARTTRRLIPWIY